MNDWHGTVPRQWAEAYFGRWWMLRKGVIWQPYLEPEVGMGWGWNRGGFHRFFLADFSQKKIDLVICSDIVVELIDVIDNWDWVYGISNYT